jgi:outer membrane protein insertion porin family
MGQQRWLRAVFRIAVLFAFILALVPSELTQAQGTAVFSRIDVAGNTRIEADTIRVFSGIEPGVPATPEDLNLAVRRLFDTGLFEDVTVMPQAGRLVITVVENPTINQIAFEGNDAIDDDTLFAAIQLRPRLAFSTAAAEADAQRIIDAYRQSGRFAASVNPVIIRQPDNRVDLVFEVYEGRPTRVQRINFIGNQAFPDRQLRRVVETSQANWLSGLFGRATFDADRLELDSELLRQFYLQRGYADVRVLSATSEIDRSRGGFFVTFTVSEGQQYTFGDISLSSQIPGLDPVTFEPLLAPVLGRGVYDIRDVDLVIERIVFAAGQAGYAFVEVRPNVTRDAANRVININFEILPTPRVFVERIDITGNNRTLDRVIRRQFRIVEGDAFNAREIRDAQDRIRGLGFFSEASVNVREGSTPDRALVQVEVEEQPTGSLNLGGAFSTNEGFTARISITERNFLGRGQTVSGAIAANQEFANVEFGFVEPALFDRDLLAGFTVYYRDRSFSEQTFEQTNIGFEPRVGFPLSENGRLILRYHLSQDEIRNEQPDTSLIIQDEAGSAVTSAVGATYTYDRRNSVVQPTAGFILTVSQEFAGLGGDMTYSKTGGTARAYASLFDEQVVLSAELEGGALFSQDDTRITDRFSAGGDSLRGFARNGVGPRDFCRIGDCLPPQQNLKVDEALGGNYFAALRLDASFPLGLPEEYGIFGGVFADIGTLWGLNNTNGSMGQVDDSLHWRSAVGVSLFVETPFAPLRFNYAFPIEYQEHDELERFRFTIQTRF